MTSPVTRADVIFLVVWEAVMVPLAVFGPRDWSALAIALGLAGAVIVGLVVRWLVRPTGPVVPGAPSWLRFPVLLVLFSALLIGLRTAGAPDSAGTLMVGLGVCLTGIWILDRWWSNRRPSRAETPATPG
jgi:hypothetical protein